VLGCQDGRILATTCSVEAGSPERVTLAPLTPYHRHQGAVTAVAVRDEHCWATGGADGAVLLWQGEEGPDGVRVVNGFVGYSSVVVLKWLDGDQLLVSLRDGRLPRLGIHRLTVRGGECTADRR
jgi:hypothetical protein